MIERWMTKLKGCIVILTHCVKDPAREQTLTLKK